MNTTRCFKLFALSLAVAGCGVGPDSDPSGSRNDPLNGSVPVQSCSSLNEQSCLAEAARCETVYSNALCPAIACAPGSTCPPTCPPPAFLECRDRYACAGLDETSCLARTDCHANYSGGICPAIACQDPANCPDLCPPRQFNGCSDANVGCGGGGVTGGSGGSGGVTGSGSGGAGSSGGGSSGP